MCYDYEHQNLWLFTWRSIQSVCHYHAKRYQPHPTPRNHTHTRARTHTHTHTHTQCAAYFIQRCLHANTTRAMCFPLHLFTDPHPDRPYTHPYTDEPHPSWSSTQKDSSGHCSCLYVYVCSAVCALCSKLPDCFQIRPSWRQRYPIACSCTLL